MLLHSKNTLQTLNTQEAFTYNPHIITRGVHTHLFPLSLSLSYIQKLKHFQHRNWGFVFISSFSVLLEGN